VRCIAAPLRHAEEEEEREREEGESRQRQSVFRSVECVQTSERARTIRMTVLDFNPNLASAPSLVSPSPNEGAPLKGSSGTTPLERHAENTPLKGSQAPALLERTLLEERPQASPEEETVLDTTLDAVEEDSGSELDWRNPCSLPLFLGWAN
jgi:hypothetical protein